MVSLSKLTVKRNCYPLTGSDRMRIVYKPVPNTINSYWFVEKNVLISDFEAYDLNKKYEVSIYNVVFTDYDQMNNNGNDFDQICFDMSI